MTDDLTWDNAPETLKVSEAAKLANLHVNSIRIMIHQERLPAVKPVGTQWRIQKSDLADLMKTEPPKVLCELCQEEVNKGRPHHTIDTWTFHKNCYEVVVERLKNFIKLLTLPQDEFDKRMANDSY